MYICDSTCILQYNSQYYLWYNTQIIIQIFLIHNSCQIGTKSRWGQWLTHEARRAIRFTIEYGHLTTSTSLRWSLLQTSSFFSFSFFNFLWEWTNSLTKVLGLWSFHFKWLFDSTEYGKDYAKWVWWEHKWSIQQGGGPFENQCWCKFE